MNDKESFAPYTMNELRALYEDVPLWEFVHELDVQRLGEDEVKEDAQGEL